MTPAALAEPQFPKIKIRGPRGYSGPVSRLELQGGVQTIAQQSLGHFLRQWVRHLEDPLVKIEIRNPPSLFSRGSRSAFGMRPVRRQGAEQFGPGANRS